MKGRLAGVLLAWAVLAAGAQASQDIGLPLAGLVEKGRVRKVSKDLVTFAPLAGGPDVTVLVGAETQLTEHDKPTKLKDLRRGSLVRIAYPINAGILTAESITILNVKPIRKRNNRQE